MINCNSYDNFDTDSYRIEEVGIDEYIAHLRGSVAPSNERLLADHSTQSRYVEYDDLPNTYDYYRRFINDVLSQIRKGRKDYVFRPYHLQELLRFEPNLKVTYDDGIFEVSLAK